MRSAVIKVAIGVIASLVAIPSFAVGASLMSSLIIGKTPEEAVSILALRLDSLMGRLDDVEFSQAQNEAETAEVVVEQSKIKDQVSLLEQENSLLENKNSLLEQRSAALETENIQIKTGLQEAYGYVGAVDDEVEVLREQNAQLESKVNPPSTRIVSLFSSEHRRYSNKIELVIQVQNSGNTDTRISRIDFSISGVKLENVGKIDVGGNTRFSGNIESLSNSVSDDIIVPAGKARGITILVALVGLESSKVEEMVSNTSIRIDNLVFEGESLIQFPIN